jgi:hypothetical protein
MVWVDINGKSTARIRLATKLADRFSSDLIGISAALLPPYPAEEGYFVTSETIERERRDVEAALGRAEVNFRNVASGGRSGLEWRSDIELPEFYVASEARAADLLVIGREGRDVARSLDAGGVVLRAGRPVLVVPPNVDTLSATRIMVGYSQLRINCWAIRNQSRSRQGRPPGAIIRDTGGNDHHKRRGLTDDQIEKVTVGDRIKLGAVAGTIFQAGAGQRAATTDMPVSPLTSKR